MTKNYIIEKTVNCTHEIAKYLENIQDEELTKIPGLINGSSGICLFYLYYSKIFGNQKFYEHAYRILEKNIDSILSKRVKNPNSFECGLPGILWLLQHGKQYDILSVEIDSSFNFILERLSDEMVKQIENWNYDFLQGALGIGLCILNVDVPTTKMNNCFNYLINSIEKNGIRKEQNQICWPYRGQKDVIDLGLAHGMISIIAFLLKTYQKDIYKETCKTLIYGAIQFLFHVSNVDPQYNFWPQAINNLNFTKKSRLGWCYGDLCIEFTILRAAIIFEDDILKEQILKRLKVTAKRKSHFKNRIYDGHFCHGTSGLAHMYAKLYELTSEPLFNKAALYWLESTMTEPSFDQTYSSSKSFETNSTYPQGISLLGGVSGVGLVMLSLIDSKICFWDECLLLS